MKPFPGSGPIALVLFDRVVKHATMGKLGIIPEGMYRIIQSMVQDEPTEKDNAKEEEN
jgi:hypothetical protein